MSSDERWVHLPDGYRQRLQTSDGDVDHVARLDRTNPSRRACVDQITGHQPLEAADVSDRLRTIPNQVGYVGVLFRYAVDGEMDASGRDMAANLNRENRPDGCRETKVLAGVPRAALVARLQLQITSGHVETDGIAKDQFKRCGVRYPGAFLADGDDQLGFIVIIVGFRRKRYLAASRYGRIRKLGEKKWRLPSWILTHLACVRRIVAADAKNAKDRKGRIRPRDRYCRSLRYLKHMRHIVVQDELSPFGRGISSSRGALKPRWLPVATGRPRWLRYLAAHPPAL